MLHPKIPLWLDQQSRLGQQDTNGDYLHQCPGNGKAITISGDIKFTAESFQDTK